MGVSSSLIGHQREAEWMFAAAAYINPGDALQECGWLEPSLLKDQQVHDFWVKLKAGENAQKAAIDLGIFNKITDYMTAESFSGLYIGAFAATIADDSYMVGISEQIGAIAKALTERDIDQAQKIIGDMASARPSNIIEIPDAADAGLEFISSLDDEDRTIKTDIPSFNSAFAGFERQTLSILAARPSMGKTALGMQIATAAVEHKLRAIYFTPEMSKRILWARMACGKAKIDYRAYKARKLSPDQKQLMIDTTNDLIEKYGRGLWIDDRANITTRDIWQAVSHYNPDLFIVDHLGLVHQDGDNEVNTLHQVAWGGKQIAKEFDCAALYLYQLNRGVTTRDNKRPQMEDLRGSGRLEEDADVILFLHRDDYYDQKAGAVKVSDTDLVIAKDREGARNICIHLEYKLDEQRYYSKATL